MENDGAFKKILPKEPFKWKKVIQYFLQGLLIIAPLAITIYSIYWVISTVDGWVPIFREAVRDTQGNVVGYEVKKINNISSGEAMKYAVTGGVVDLSDVKKTELKELN